MNSFEAICYKYNRTPEEVESDLFAVLKEVAGLGKANIQDAEYKHTLHVCLMNKRCTEDVGLKYETTTEGNRVLRRGWITKDYESLRIKEAKDASIKYWTAVAAIVTAIATLITAVLTMF